MTPASPFTFHFGLSLDLGLRFTHHIYQDFYLCPDGLLMQEGSISFPNMLKTLYLDEPLTSSGGKPIWMRKSFRILSWRRENPGCHTFYYAASLHKLSQHSPRMRIVANQQVWLNKFNIPPSVNLSRLYNLPHCARLRLAMEIPDCPIYTTVLTIELNVIVWAFRQVISILVYIEQVYIDVIKL